MHARVSSGGSSIEQGPPRQEQSYRSPRLIVDLVDPVFQRRIGRQTEMVAGSRMTAALEKARSRSHVNGSKLGRTIFALSDLIGS
jgi:hypothetical protein